MEILSLLRNKSAPLPTSHPTPGPPYSMGGVRWERVATLKLVPIKLSQILANNIANGGRRIGLRIMRYCKLIRICRIQWCCELFSFLTGKVLFGEIWSKKSKLPFTSEIW